VENQNGKQSREQKVKWGSLRGEDSSPT